MRRWAALLGLTLLWMSTGCASVDHLGINQRERGAQQSTVNSLVCRGESLDGYFVASRTPDARRIEMRDEAERAKAAGKCQGGGR